MKYDQKLIKSTTKLIDWIFVFLIIFVLPASGEWIKYADNPVLTGTSPTGEPSVIEFGGTYHMWYQNDFSVWYANSTDGLNWTPSGKVFGDGRQLSPGTVLRGNEGTYKMWYSWGGTSGQIGYATSDDGIDWQDSGQVLGPGSEPYDAYAAERPHVMYDNSASIYKMWYTAGASVSVGRTIAYATSIDGKEWTKSGVVFAGDAGTWYSYAVGGPYVEKTDTGYTMWFSGSLSPGPGATYSIGHTYSEDGVNWNRDTVTLDLVPGSVGSWDERVVDGPSLLRTSAGQTLLYYRGAGFNDPNPIGIGVAIPEPATIEATVEINPNTLNLQSNGKWITCYIWLPEDYNVVDINSASVVFHDTIKAEWTWVEEEDQVMMAKFSRSVVQSMLQPGLVELSVSGKLNNGTGFQGKDTITVINQGKP